MRTAEKLPTMTASHNLRQLVMRKGPPRLRHAAAETQTP